MKLSIIIPTLHEEKIIGRTLKALKGLGSFEYEIIVSDGHSKDRTVEIAKEYADKVVVHDGRDRQTIAAGRNAGAAVASGEFLVFLDADCSICGPEAFFKKIFAHFSSDPKLVAVSVAIRVLPENETFLDWAMYNIFNDIIWFMNNIVHFGMSTGEFQMVRKEAFNQIDGYNSKLVAAEDMDLFKRLSKIGHVRYQKNLVVYHTGRRAHKIGWPKLLMQWGLNFFWAQFTGHSYSRSWGGDM